MLHAFFEFAKTKKYCDTNPIKNITRKRVYEKEIFPLRLSEIRSLLNVALSPKFQDFLCGFAIMLFAGIRPEETSRLTWNDIDLDENTILVRPQKSKTGGGRHITIQKPLKIILSKHKKSSKRYICPQNWKEKWKRLRDKAGFKNRWTQDVLRHTFASYHLKYFKNIDLLQTEMGHRNKSKTNSRTN